MRSVRGARCLALGMRLVVFVSVLSFSAPSSAQSPSTTPDDETNLGKSWNFHIQVTAIPQGHGDLHSPYASDHSLSAKAELQTSFTTTFFAGHTLWQGAELYINPEILAGKGLSTTQGVAGFPNGEIYRVDTPRPRFNLARCFIRQTWGLGGGRDPLGNEQNQIPGSIDTRRIVLTVGKFSLIDVFDDNTYSHDARSQFLNWALMDNGAWDFAADTRGYTYGFALELNDRRWAVRFASVMVPKDANGMALDTRIANARADNLELEHRHEFKGHPGALRLMGFMNHAHMGNYRTTIDTPVFQMDITKSRSYSLKYGFGLNAEQEVAKDIGVFVRYGWNDAHTETWAFTEIDRTGSAGLSVKGERWSRPRDRLGVALVVNGISRDHADYLRAGGKGFIIGDGALNYGREKIVESYYLFSLGKGFAISPDFQQVVNPAYNRDRGPASVWAVRLHWEL